MNQYKGFQIDPLNRIYKDGREIFTAFYQRCFSLQEAKDMIDHSLSAPRPGVNYGKALTKLMGSDEDTREQEAEDFAEKVNTHFEMQAWEPDKY